MTQLLEYIKMALDNLKANKGRSFLTMLGIIIGIASVIMIIAIGNGAQSKISGELNSMAGGMLQIYVNTTEDDGNTFITIDDIKAIKEKVPHIKGISPYAGANGTAITSKGDFAANIQGESEDAKYFLTGESIDSGHFYSMNDVLSGKSVGVINERDALKLFGTVDVVGMPLDVTVNNMTKKITIVGVTKKDNEDSMLAGMMGNSDQISITVPYTLLEQGYGIDMDEFQFMLIVGESATDASNIAKQTIPILEARHDKRGQNVYYLQNFSDMLSGINTVMSTITIFIVFVAGISLLVGGIGVMNIMLVSVTERTREIGIRKALGARTRSIMIQFLLESGFITLIGGLIGILIGVGGAELICSLPMLNFAPKLQVSVILITTLFSSAVGIFFGIYPARKAAKMSPIEALRSI